MLRMPFYAVRKGVRPGVYQTWEECKQQVHGFSGARYKKFSTSSAAERFVRETSQPASDPAKTSDNTAGSNPQPSIEITKQPVKSRRAAIRALLNPYDRSGSASASVKRTETVVPPSIVDGGGFRVDDNGYVHVWTDGACCNNGAASITAVDAEAVLDVAASTNGSVARAGIGVWFGRDHPLNVSAPVSGSSATNNNAEIQAAWHAIELASAAGFERVLVHTDSQFVISCADRWLPRWLVNGWRLTSGAPVKNRAQLERLHRAMQDVHVKWNHVPGHCGIEGNEEADKLACRGALMYKAGN